MTQRMLVLTPRFPYPLYGGDVLRIYRICEALSGFQLTLLSICQTKEEMEAELPQDSPFAEVHRVFLPKWRSYLSALKALVTGKSMQVAYYTSDAYAAAVEQLQGSHDAVLCHLVRSAPYARAFSGKRILEMTDYIPLTYARSNALKNKSLSLRRLIYTLEKERVDRAQNDLAPTFDLITFVSDVDSEMFRQSSKVPKERIATFSNGVSIEDRPFKGRRTGKTLAFIGTLKAMPNADAVTHFIRAVLPIVARSEPDIRLKVVGAVDDKFKARFQDCPQVTFTGPVSDLAGAVDDCVVGICPVRIGAGVQNKMLDYMALGLAAVTTSLGAEGLDGAAGSEYLVADEPEDYANAVLSFVRDTPLRERFALAGRKMIEDTYSWETRLSGLPDRVARATRHVEERVR